MQRSIRAADQGAVVIIFAIALPLVVTALLITLDYTRAATTRTALSQALDSISQSMTREIFSCIARHGDPRQDPETHPANRRCLTDAGLNQNLEDRAKSLLVANFHQNGASGAPVLVGLPYYDRAANLYRYAGAVDYDCIVQRSYSECRVAVKPANATADAIAFTITGPETIEVWIGDRSPDLPAAFRAWGADGAIQYMIGSTGLRGLSIDPISGFVDGVPEAIPCTHPCNPHAGGTLQVAAEAVSRSGDAVTRVTATTGAALHVVHPVAVTVRKDDRGDIVSSRNGPFLVVPIDRSGGRGPYRYEAHGGAGVSADEKTGAIAFDTRVLENASGRVVVTVTDARGRYASTSIDYRIEDGLGFFR